ncbi:hypothetical protein Tco_0521871 [Tanacetum coccineum]
MLTSLSSSIAEQGSQYVSCINLKKCYSDDPLLVLLEGLQVDDKLHFVEEPIEIMDHEVKQLRQSRVPIVKVRWNSSAGPLSLRWNEKINSEEITYTSLTKTAPSSRCHGHKS